MNNAVRARVLGAICVVVFLAIAGPAAASRSSAPVITLLAPANGATVVSSTTVYPTFKWQIQWDAPENTTVGFETASDPGFTQNHTLDNFSCSAANVNCSDSFQPHIFWAGYTGVWYWRVSLTSSAGIVYSQTFTFKAAAPADTDHDGVADAEDNCPSVANPDQRDSNHDRKGDACQADRVAPQVTVAAGSAHRGQRLYIHARVGDDRGNVRVRVWMTFQGHLLLNWHFGPLTGLPGTPAVFYSKSPVPTRVPSGIYRACVKAWDPAGNHAVSCAAYRIT